MAKGALNFNALKGLQEDLKRKSGDTDDLIYTKDLGEENDFKIAPPFPDMEGVYVVEQIIWWIKKKPYTSLLTWGEDCPLKEETEIAKDDPDLAELVDDKDNFKAEKSQYLIPGYMLDVKYGDDNTIEDVRVRDNKGKILVSNISLLKKVNKCVTSRQAGEDITDNEIGFPLVLMKSGKGLDTEYDALIWRDHLPLDEKYYTDEKYMPMSPWKFLKELKETPEYLRSVIRNYFYGEDILKKDEKPAGTQKPAASPARRAAAVDDGDEDGKPTPKRTVAAEPERKIPTRKVEAAEKESEAPKKKTGGSRLLDSIADLD